MDNREERQRVASILHPIFESQGAWGELSKVLEVELEDLTDPALAGRLVVENPATSSPGLAFLLATVAYFGEDPETGWPAFWRALRDNDVAVSSGWEEAYYGYFSGAGGGEGDLPIVVSYASSPAAEVIYLVRQRRVTVRRLARLARARGHRSAC